MVFTRLGSKGKRGSSADIISHSSRNSSGSGVIGQQQAFSLYIVLAHDSKNPVPVIVPTDVTIQYIKEILKATGAELPNGNSWDQVEFFTDEKCWFALSETTNIAAMGIKDQQKLYVQGKSGREKITAIVQIPNRSRPLTVKNLPPYSTVGGLMEVMKSVLDQDEINLNDFWLRRETDSERLPKGLLLDRLDSSEKLIAECNISNWENFSQNNNAQRHHQVVGGDSALTLIYQKQWTFWVMIMLNICLLAIVFFSCVPRLYRQLLGQSLDKNFADLTTHDTNESTMD